MNAINFFKVCSHLKRAVIKKHESLFCSCTSRVRLSLLQPIGCSNRSSWRPPHGWLAGTTTKHGTYTELRRSLVWKLSRDLFGLIGNSDRVLTFVKYLTFHELDWIFTKPKSDYSLLSDRQIVHNSIQKERTQVKGRRFPFGRPYCPIPSPHCSPLQWPQLTSNQVIVQRPSLLSNPIAPLYSTSAPAVNFESSPEFVISGS